MLYYSDSPEVRLGDLVDFDGEPGVVIEILETAYEVATAEMDGPAVGFLTESLGRVYESTTDRGWESVSLVRRNV
jgi:hypothetical protein